MRASVFATGVIASLLSLRPVHAIDLLNGQWTLNPGEAPGQVHLMLVRSGRPGNTFTSGSDWNAADLKGLDLATPGKHDVHFSVVRDAGAVEAEGFVTGTEGVGLFKFTPNPKYSADMAAAGFPGVEDEKQLGLALIDVSLAFAREMQALKIDGLDLRSLRAFRVHKIDATYVKALRAEGLVSASARDLVAFRIHGVTPEYVKAVKAQGFTPTERQLVTMRIHEVTPDYIAGLKKRGMEKLTLDKIISLKIHGIS